MTAATEWSPPASRFAWLLSVDAAVPSAPGPSDQEVEEAAAVLQVCWHILPAALPRFLAWAGAARHQLPCVEALKARATAIRTLTRVQLLLLHRVTAELERRRVPHVLLKSSALRWMAYDEPTDRGGIDVDLGVAPRVWLPACIDALSSLGFEAAQWNDDASRFEPADRVQRARVERDHYELGFLVRRQRMLDLPPAIEASIRGQLHRTPNAWHLLPSGELACYVVLDVHHGISREIGVEPILASSVPVRVEGTTFRVPRPSWAMFHLIFKLYWEGVHAYKTIAYQYADVCRLMRRMDARELEHLFALLREWRLVAAGYFVLRRLESDLGIPSSPPLAHFLDEASRADPSLDPITENDLGDMWPKIWGRR
jgi:hypothetical protein